MSDMDAVRERTHHRGRVVINHDARREDLAWMAETGETFAGAAKRLGVTTDALGKWCERHDMAVGTRLRENERESI